MHDQTRESDAPAKHALSTGTSQALADPVSGRPDSTSPPMLARLFHTIQFDLRRLTLALAVLVAIVFVRAPFTQVPDALFVSDGFGYYIYLPSLVIDGDLDLANQLERLPYEGEKHFFRVSPETGRHTNQFPVGCAILWAPFFILADCVVRTLSAIGVPVDRTGFGFAYELPVYIGSFLYGLAGIYVMRLTLLRILDCRTAEACLFAIVFATPLAYYLWFEPNMSHYAALFLISLWVYQLQRVYESDDRRFLSWLLLGLVLGLAALIRPYNGVLGLTAIPVAVFVSRTAEPRISARVLWRAAAPP